MFIARLVKEQRTDAQLLNALDLERFKESLSKNWSNEA